MARYLDIVVGSSDSAIVKGTNDHLLQLHGSEATTFYLLCMIVISVSIISMVIFACSPSAEEKRRIRAGGTPRKCKGRLGDCGCCSCFGDCTGAGVGVNWCGDGGGGGGGDGGDDGGGGGDGGNGGC